MHEYEEGRKQCENNIAVTITSENDGITNTSPVDRKYSPVELGVSANAASWNGPTIEPRTIQPKEPVG
ncbi:hypothetical protein BC938DRAFT_474999 [Jimgerdemannia flammicorona]|uniref:Uncharacterized protein n=1 Tax=Jimgerdemannia flammicorona TaxID=994334 RepID=A0A433QS59_9FUNG|nr:hypothetical protein BC938DRAFT_474999 [Jimgerdemannia flammicorona]